MTRNFAKCQTINNLQARDAWDRVASHRQHVTQLLLDAAPSGGRLCILGAGNCLDVSLDRLLDRFSHIALFDIDLNAMEFGIRQQISDQHPGRQKIQCNVIDLCGWTGITDPVFESLGTSSPEWQEVLRSISQFSPSLDDFEPFDVVASNCLLSQIIAPVLLRQPHDPLQISLAIEFRRSHLDLMWKLAGQEGSLVLISDFVATDTSPELRYLSSDQLGEKMFELIRNGNFFSGLNPQILAAELAGHTRVKTGKAHPRAHPPWLWHLHESRAYLVIAFSVINNAKLGGGACE